MIRLPLALLLLAAASPAQGPDGSRLYGRVTTEEGAVVEGYFRWDRNEAGRADFLDATKEIPREVLQQAERLDPVYADEARRRRSLVAFGMRIRWDEDDLEGPPTTPAAIRLAHVAVIEPLEGARARLTLVDGRIVELLASTTDLGPGMRDLEVQTKDRGVVEVDWHDMVKVEFFSPPADAHAAADSALFGTVRTWGQLELTGRIGWDRDEIFLSDVLDGRDGSTERDIAFREIRDIAPEGRRSAAVRLASGDSLSLRGSNDVDGSNRGVEVTAMAWGRAIVRWEDLEIARFHPPAPEPPPVDPGPLRGTVYALDGRVLEGWIRWGHDEESGWELLDGWHGDTDVQIEFGAIEQIRPDDGGALVSLVDGRVLRLEGTDDVGEGHRGVYVTTASSSTRLVRWSDVDRVLFAR